MNSIIARHNSKISKSNQNDVPPPPCRHRKGTDCPLGGPCKTPSIVYQATVTSDDKTETYTGLTEPPFQDRWENHQSDFRHQDRRSNMPLASYIWDIKDQKKDFSVKFDILKKARAFCPITGKCMLCLNEKYFILFNPKGSTLNKRSEFFNSCRHKNNKSLSSEKT